MTVDPYRYFRVEARELVEQLGQGALDLEKRAPSAETVARLLRFAHTLKGAARVVKQTQIAERAHRLEDLFTGLRDRPTPPAREEIDEVLGLLDAIGASLAALAAPDAAPAAAAAATGDHPQPVHALRPAGDDIEALIRGIEEAQLHLVALRPGLDEADRIGHLIELIGNHLRAADRRPGGGPLDRQRLEKAVSLVDELRVRFGALQREVSRGVDQIEGEVRQVGDAAARLRLVSANALFRFLERAARDVAQVLGKRVTFEGRGGDVRVDSDILTIVQGALLQLVRNAVAHGLEAGEAKRRAAGKSPEGRVIVSVVRRDAAIAFVCADDGAGIDFDAVRETLRRRQVLAVGARVDDDALLGLLLKGGITTSGAVTGVAGRGIGLDIVREAAERLHGDVTINSKAGQGTTVELVVPASIAAFQALLVETAGVTAAIPLDAVRQTLRVMPAEVIEHADARSVICGDAVVPLWSLRAIVRPQEGHQRITAAASAFVVEAGARAAAVVVDHVRGTGVVVMRPLPALAVAVPAIAGASLDAGGRPRLVLDPAALVAEAERSAVRFDDAAPSPRRVLVVDDSLTTRMLEQSILESAGYEVSLATSAEEGLEKARAGDYALFLVDIEMPGMDGFSFIEQVRADPALRRTPAILITSRASADDRRRGQDVGAQGYIVKDDFDQGALLEQIRSLV